MTKKYGDLLGACVMIGFGVSGVLPGIMADPSRKIAYVVAASFVWSIVFGFSSFLKGTSTTLSVCAIAGDVVTIALMDGANFPEYDDSPLVAEFVWLLILISANFDLPFRVKAGLGLFACAGCVTAAFHAPLVTDLSETLPIFFGGTAIHIFLHYLLSLGRTDLVTMHGAQAVLTSVFVYHTWTEIQKIELLGKSPKDGGFVLGKVCFFAAIGLASVGAFRKNIDDNERLEVLVEERTKQIRQQEDKLHIVGLALQASETAIAITDADQRIIWLNPALEHLCKAKEYDLQNRCIVDVLHLSQDDGRRLRNTFDVDSRKEDEIMVGDAIINAEVSPFPDKNRNSDETGKHRFVVALKDITEFRALQRAEKMAEREAMMAKAMSESMETLTHELRTPLQGIMGMCSILVGDESLPDDSREPLELIMASSGLLLVLINNLLDMRKCNANMMDDFQLSPVPSVGPMKDATDFCRPLAAISSVNIEIDPGDTDHAIIMSNALRLQQILINLTSNAIKYTPGGSMIRIHSRTSTLGEVQTLMKNALASGSAQSDEEASSDNEGTKVLVMSVTDSGPGITPGQESRIFRKFSRLNSKQANKLGTETAGQPTGTGLGLNLCLKFVQLMEGGIWAKNNPDQQGSTFSFYLPLVSNVEPLRPNATKMEGNVPMKVRHSLSDSSCTSNYRVLIVDDILINRKVLDRMLRKIGVGHVNTVESGSDALKELEKVEYDIVISDLQMPGMSGTELSEAIRKTNLLPTKPVVIGLTADTGKGVDERCLASGMADVIHKPITVVEMSDYFETVVRRLAPPPKTI